ncbi:MAG TPA: diguanylate cyclase [bacterium]|nr:diguanylate cyclase [bacterium]
MLESSDKPSGPSVTHRKILIIGGPKQDLGKTLQPHQILRTRTLEASFDILSETRPDVIVHFVHGADEPLEECILTWLIGGFRGNLAVFDPQNKLKDFQSLLDGNLIDAYVPGPVSPDLFASVIKSHMNPATLGGASRSYALFELFRHLFDRAMDAIFFFTDDLKRCVAANRQAEKLTGLTLFELRRSDLAALCGKPGCAEIEKTVKRARHNYYDAHGQSEIKDRLGRPMAANFSVGLFHFGRSSFVKFEIQNAAPANGRGHETNHGETKKDRLTYKRRHHDLAGGNGDLSRGVSMLVCRVHLPEHAEDEDRTLEAVADKIRVTIRKTDSLARLSRAQFAVLLPKTTAENVEAARKRLQKALAQSVPKGCRLDFESAHCPQEAYPFLQLLENAAHEAPERKRAFG